MKPGLFTNEFLVALGPAHAILFQALWCMADRRGILEDRPGRIRIQAPLIGPLDVDKALDDLQRFPARFILRYQAPTGERCILILNFRKHQNPHSKERASDLPDYEPAKCQHMTSTGPASEIPAPARLIPDSGSLIPFPQKKDGKEVAVEPATPPAPRKAPAAKKGREHWQTVYAHIFEKLKAKKHGQTPHVTQGDRGLLGRLYDTYGPWTVMAAWDLWMETGKKWSKWAYERGYCVEAFWKDFGSLQDDPALKPKAGRYESAGLANYKPKADELPLDGVLKGIAEKITAPPAPKPRVVVR